MKLHLVLLQLKRILLKYFKTAFKLKIIHLLSVPKEYFRKYLLLWFLLQESLILLSGKIKKKYLSKTSSLLSNPLTRIHSLTLKCTTTVMIVCDSCLRMETPPRPRVTSLLRVGGRANHFLPSVRCTKLKC